MCPFAIVRVRNWGGLVPPPETVLGIGVLDSQCTENPVSLSIHATHRIITMSQRRRRWYPSTSLPHGCHAEVQVEDHTEQPRQSLVWTQVHHSRRLFHSGLLNQGQLGGVGWKHEARRQHSSA